MGKIGARMRVKGIILIMMMLVVVMGCNSGGVLEEEQGKNKFLQSLVNVSNEFLNVFTSFGEMIGSVLGLNVDSKKSDVGKYFKTVQETVQGTKDGLNKIVADMKKESNPNAAATETVVNKLVSETLDKIIEGAKTVSEAIGITGDELIGNVADKNTAGVKAEETSVKSLSEGIGKIVSVVLGQKGTASAGDDNKAGDGGARTAAAGDGEAGKLFITGNGAAGDDATKAKKVAADAAKAVGAVTGADILQAISVGSEGKSAKLAKNNAANVTAVDAKRDAVLAGGIALRAMAKNGKFANGDDDADVSNTIKGVAVSAVIKALDTLTIGMRKTIDTGLESVKEAMKINADANPKSSDNNDISKSNQ
ncbi:variable large family protein [Borrelia crocidurae]|nr:variable large family protein [Borrelia crocidurae]